MARYKRKLCLLCGKAIYRTREDAYGAIRRIPIHKEYHFLKPYRCGELWHVGHDHKMYDVFKDKAAKNAVV